MDGIDTEASGLSVAPGLSEVAATLTRRLKRAALLERAARYVGMYTLSAVLLLILLSPIWIWLLFF